ncbi:MAG: DUF2236 domain-containing protein [Sandaracinus sp.]|nr:DUF2236 domain-containing protein [Sandaracinus sp.]MCB9620286.1 DUF2236 domain-containing protein [Sandaracinus sp.]MCB9634047.1 DUF2236 domain-containing protein [Sandaracinus sp.]
MPTPTRFRDPRTNESRHFALFRRLHRLPPPGEESIWRFRDTLFDGDPLADALVAEPGFTPTVVRQALDEGIGAIASPSEALVALFAEVERRPAWLDEGLLERAATTALRVGLDGARVLSCICLTGGYRSSAANKPLTFTGALEAMAPRRLAETSQFVVDLYESRTLDRASEGFASAVRVRVMHAMVRARLSADPRWRAQDWGAPVNQADLLATNLLFSTVFVFGLRMLGHVITRREADALVHFWRYVGFLMGVRDALLPKDFEEACALVHVSGTCQPPGDDDSRRLAAALLAVPSSPDASASAQALDRQWRAAFSRLALGQNAGDELGLPRAPRWIVLGTVARNLAVEALRFALPSLLPALRSRRSERVRRHVSRNLEGRRPAYEPYALR